LRPPAFSDAEAMDAPMTDPHKPNLRVGIPREQSLRRRKRLVGDLEFPCVHVDRNDPAMIAGFHLRTYAILVDFSSQAGVHFFGQSRLPNRH
jgi:hypothetical protein